MPKITFTRDFDWAPPQLNGRWLRAYKTGWTGLVTTPCAAAAIAKGAAAIARTNGEVTEQGSRATQAGGHPAESAKRRKAGARSKR